MGELKSDLLINGLDAYANYGVRPGEGFIDALFAPAPLKEFIENKSRLQDGVRVVVANPKQDARDLTLTFTLESTSVPTEDKPTGNYRENYNAFISELMKGSVSLKMPPLGEETYYLIYQKSTSFAMNMARTASKISVKFLEPDPTYRSSNTEAGGGPS